MSFLLEVVAYEQLVVEQYVRPRQLADEKSVHYGGLVDDRPHSHKLVEEFRNTPPTARLRFCSCCSLHGNSKSVP
jgi:hypothetical protein